MKLTRSVSYALGVLLRVHEHRSNRPMTAAEISEGCEFPPRFLYRVLRRLVDAGLLSGTSGPGGGYALMRPATRISLLQIVEAVEGPLEASDLEPVSRKQRGAVEAVNKLSRQSVDQFGRQLAKTNLATLSRAKASKTARPKSKRKSATRRKKKRRS